jgi:hypothetical protein
MLSSISAGSPGCVPLGGCHGVEGPADRPSFHRPIILEFSSSALEQLPDQIAALQVEWDRASAAAKGEGSFFIAQPHHCAVGTKPG